MSKFSYLLLALFLIFLSLYLVNPSIFSRTFEDLWAAVLAGAITALLIERIIDYSNIEKSRLSREYVKSRLLRICNSLMFGLAPAIKGSDYLKRSDHGDVEWTWENAIKHDYDSKEWAWYYQHVNKSREEALKRIRYIIDNQRDLLEDKLQNDIFAFLDVLEENNWQALEKVEKDDDIEKLYMISELAAETLNEAFKILNDHKLLEYQQVSHFKRKRTSFKGTNKRKQEYDLKRFENLLNQSVSFKAFVKGKMTPALQPPETALPSHQTSHD